MTDYSTKSDEELSALKRAADEEMVELREAMRSVVTDDAKKAGVAATLKALRQVKLDIQNEQDKRLKPIPENPDHVLGISGAVTQSAMGNIGGSPEEPPVSKKKRFRK